LLHFKIGVSTEALVCAGRKLIRSDPIIVKLLNEACGRELTWTIKIGCLARAFGSPHPRMNLPGHASEINLMCSSNAIFQWLLCGRGGLPVFARLHLSAQRNALIIALVPLLQKWPKHIVDMAFLIPSGLRKCWIWKGFVAFDRTVNIQGIGIVVYCAGQAILAGVAFLLTQVSEDRLYAGAGQNENPHRPQKL